MNTTIRFIRACKSEDPRSAVLKVYREEYLPNDTPYPFIAGILSQIVERYGLISITTLISNLSPSAKWLYAGENLEGEEAWYERVTNILISNIHNSEPEKFGVVIAQKLRDLYENQN